MAERIAGRMGGTPQDGPHFDPLLLRAMRGSEWRRVLAETERPVRAVISVLAPKAARLATEDQEALYEELVQETYFRAARYIHSWDASRPLITWLYEIARNVARAAHQQYDTKLALVRDDPAGSIPEPASDEDDALTRVVRSETMTALECAIEMLPQRQREAFELHALQGLSHAEAGEQVGVSSAAMQRAYAVAREKLRPVAIRIMEDDR